MKEDKSYMIRKVAVLITCMVVFITVGLVVLNFQSKIVTVDYYGNINTAVTMSNTVEGFLMQNKIYIDEKAVVYPSVDTRITDNMQIKIYSEDEKEAKLDLEEITKKATAKVIETKVEEIQYIDYEITEKSNASLNRGTTKTLQDGEKGEKVVTYKISTVNGKEIAKEVLTEEITKTAVNQVVEVGTKITTVSRSGSSFNISTQDLTVDNGFKKYNIKLSEELQKYTYNMCKKYSVPYEALLAIMYVESGYNPNTISATNDYGLCQINKSNHAYLSRTLGVTNFLDPYQNIKAGAYFLSRYYASWSSQSGTIRDVNVFNSYNMGEGAYRAYLNRGNSPYRAYSTKVINAMNALINNGGL